MLIDRGADFNATDEEGMTALGWTARIDHGHPEIAAALLEAGADPSIASSNGRTPLDWAEFLDNREVANLLSAATGRERNATSP